MQYMQLITFSMLYWVYSDVFVSVLIYTSSVVQTDKQMVDNVTVQLFKNGTHMLLVCGVVSD